MAQGIVSDNWSLQDITGLLVEGMSNDETHEIQILDQEFIYKPISHAAIQTEALFDFLTDIVLRDEILVDQEFDFVWQKPNNPLLKAKEMGIVRSFPFLNEPEKLNSPRDKILEHMCSTTALREAHQENVESYKKTGQSKHSFLSQTMWGGAGMCARSFVYEKSYTPHPLRKRFFVNSGFMLPADDALHQLTSFLHDEKMKVSKKLYGNDVLYSSFINIPSIPIRVIQESSSFGQLVAVALEMRSDFLKLREWLKKFQNALTNDDIEEIGKYRKQLDSISNYINSKIGLGVHDKPITMEAGLGIFKIGKKTDFLNSIKNQFGVRATLNKLIFGTNGKGEIKKFTQMFGEHKSTVGYVVEQHFTKN